jgi:hypothetical protein
MRRVFTTPRSFEAHLIWGLLEANGIEAVVMDDELAGMLIGWVTSMRSAVWVVDDAEAGRAEALIAEHTPSDDDEEDEAQSIDS